MAWLITRRGSDAELKGDVQELAVLVERLAKADRRERMSRVRRGEKDAGLETPAGGFPVPPGAEGLEVPGTVAHFDKAALRRQIMQGKLGGRV